MVAQCIAIQILTLTLTLIQILNHNYSYLVVISIISMISNVKVPAYLFLLFIMINHILLSVMLRRLLLVLSLNLKLIMLSIGQKDQMGGCVYRVGLVGSLLIIIMSILILNIFLIPNNFSLLFKKLKGMSVPLILL